MKTTDRWLSRVMDIAGTIHPDEPEMAKLMATAIAMEESRAGTISLRTLSIIEVIDAGTLKAFRVYMNDQLTWGRAELASVGILSPRSSGLTMAGRELWGVIKMMQVTT